MTRTDSMISWHPWQQRAFDDDARIMVLNWHRQAGKDFCAAGIAVDDAMRTGNDWYIVSLTQRQSDATHAKCGLFARAYRESMRIAGAVRAEQLDYDAYDRWLESSFRFTARHIVLPNGARVVSLPGRDPDTLAGLTGNVIFTEFGLFPGGGYDHWRTVFPLATRGYRILVISTPRGRNTKYYELASDAETYSVHTQTITDSLAEGFVLRGNDGEPITLDEFRRLYRDEMGWRREYMCEFVGELNALLRWDQLRQAGLAETGVSFAYRRVRGDETGRADVRDLAGWIASLGAPADRWEIGWDVARSGDVSPVWINERVPAMGGSAAACRAVIAMTGVRYADQRAVVRAAMDTCDRNVGCGDATGLGAESNEQLNELYGDRWEPVTFTAARKRELASGLATAYSDLSQGLPPQEGDGKVIHADLYALQADRTGDQLKIEATPNPLLEESHCDIAWANALAIRAGGLEGAVPDLWIPGEVA